MEFNLGFSKTTMKVSIDEKNLLGVLHANEIEIGLTGADEVKRSIENPINSKRLCEIVKKGEKIAIITSDITRPMPSKVVLPFVIEELKREGQRMKILQ